MTLDDETIKYGLTGLLGIISIGVRWIWKRLTHRVDTLENKVNALEINTVSTERMNRELDEIRELVTESRREFRDEHSRTRTEIKEDNRETRELLVELIKSKDKQ